MREPLYEEYNRIDFGKYFNIDFNPQEVIDKLLTSESKLSASFRIGMLSQKEKVMLIERLSFLIKEDPEDIRLYTLLGSIAWSYNIKYDREKINLKIKEILDSCKSFLGEDFLSKNALKPYGNDIQKINPKEKFFNEKFPEEKIYNLEPKNEFWNIDYPRIEPLPSLQELIEELWLKKK